MSNYDTAHLFKLFDADADGYISKDELLYLLRAQGFLISNKDAEELANRCTNPAAISLNEYTTFTAGLTKPDRNSEHYLLEAFRVFDKEDNGLIHENDLRVIFTSLGDTVTMDEMNAILAQCSLDEVGRIKYVEFAKLILKGAM